MTRLLPGLRERRIAIVVRPFIAFRIALMVLAYPSSLSAQAAPAAAAEPRMSRAVASALEVQLAGIFRSQAQSGAYAFPASARDLSRYPLFATMSWDAYRATGNTAGASQAAYSVARYYSYLFSTADRDGDRLIETRAPWGGEDERVEDPGFNALLAADAQRLARMNLELRRTMPALYWYDGARAIARTVVARTFDAEAGYFFPADAVSGRLARHVSAIAALSASFDGLVGGNITEMVAARHVVPWASELAQSRAGSGATSTLTVERLVAIDVLRDTGRGEEVAALRALDLLGAASPDLVSVFAAERAMLDDPLLDHTVALDIFYMLVRSCGRFRDADVVRLEASIRDVKALAFGAGMSPSIESAERAVRDVYTTVSQLREYLGVSTFWKPEDRRAYQGADATSAAHRLTDDVLVAARRAENRVFEMRYGSAGVRVTTALSSSNLVEGDEVLLRWELTSRGRALELKSLQTGVLGEALAPVAGAALAIAPGGEPLRFSARHVVRPGVRALRTVVFMIAVEDGGGGRGRYFAERSVFVRPPIAVTAKFPRGRIIQGKSVPIELSLARSSRTPPSAQYFWFSPSGLRLVEGNQGSIHFPATDAATATLNVEVPSPCRPGVFPFTLKFFSSDRDAGTISATLFKPYQWTALGPFPAKSGLGGKLPPESGVGLLQSYAGAEGMITWKPVPASACGPGGEVNVHRVIAGSGVSYLYTVVASAFETDIEARLVANCSATLIVNGRRALSVGASSDSASGMVHLDPDRNHILVKFVGDAKSVVGLTLGSNDNLAADEFNNDLMELAEGYRELVARADTGGEARTEAHRLVTFRIADPAAKSVAVVGSFNGWSPRDHKLQKRDDSTWEITLSLAPGRYAYRFLIDQKKQVLDPSTKLTEPDGFGGQNSVVIVSR
ncbi:MAG TPA: isoamylase early set domain-containing protein [Candidatus Krumholzibacteria bacterium]|nr:isoamylase early set domain-containing protein [Candidatus Krumholzibacteria bacterium]